ncbi:MAG: acyl-CoA dehydrogenase [Chloroflexi bacterium]|nr:acyl-CoA dehydrogenase [Chloroflexota bacterium]
MDFALTPDQQAFADEFRAYLTRHLTPEIREESLRFLNMSKKTDPGVFGRGEYGGPRSKEFIRRLGSDGWLGVGWPKEYGGQGRTPMEQHLFYEIIYAERAPFPVLTLNAVGPTIMKFGTDAQKKEFLPRILRGDMEVCIGYTEPEAGTDLFSLKTSAVRDGDSYVINGQKVFTSIAHLADYVWLAARTDPDASKKHKGISLFLIPMDAPGITIAPIYTLGGHRTNSVFFDSVRVHKDCLIGRENKGAECIVYQLDRERIALVPSLPVTRRIEKTMAWARKTVVNGIPVMEHPGVRSKFAGMIADVEVLKLLNYDVVQKMTKGLLVWAEASTVKVYGSELNLKISNMLLEIMGPYGQVQRSDRWAPAEGLVEEHFRDDLIFIFGGGTNEVQRDIIAMVGLGMPRSR